MVGRAGIADPEWPRHVEDPAYAPPANPWSREHLRSVAVGQAFVDYLSQMPGMVEGGAVRRG